MLHEANVRSAVPGVSDTAIALLIGATMSGVLVLDVMVTPRVPVAILYVVPVLLTLWLSDAAGRSEIGTAGVATALTAIGIAPLPLAEVATPLVFDAIGHLLAAVSVWIAAGLIFLQKRTLRRVAEAETRFHETFARTAVGIAHVAPDGRWLRANPCLLDLLGYERPEELFRRTLQEITHPEDVVTDLAKVRDLYAETIRTYSVEKRFLRSDGSIVWVLETASLVRDERGEPTYILYVIQDIGERRQAERHWVKMKTAVEGANDAIVIAAPDTRGEFVIEHVNPAFLQMFGYQQDEVLGTAVNALFVKESRFPPFVLTADAATQPAFTELVGRNREGRELITEWHTTPIRDDTGRLLHWIAVIRDVTERMTTQRALRESEECARRQLTEIETLYHTAPVGLAMLTPGLRYQRVNEKLAELHGVPAEQHIGRTPAEVVPALAEATEAVLRRVLRTGKAVLDVEFAGETPGLPGVRRFWLAHFHPVVCDGTLEGVGVVVEETTARKQHDEQMRFLMRELNHRVKNSLAVVVAVASQTIRASGSLAEFEQAFVGRIRALAATHTLLTESNWQSASLHHMVRDALKPYVGSGLASVTIAGDDLLLPPSAALGFSMILHELATNAVRHGALSAGVRGALQVSWTVKVDGVGHDLNLTWSESGGPAFQPASDRGFGLQLIAFTISHEFEGEAEVECADGNLCWRMRIPLHRLSAPLSIAV